MSAFVDIVVSVLLWLAKGLLVVLVVCGVIALLVSLTGGGES